MDQARAMDRMYRYQRHVYDLTRKYYLLGRDRLLDGLPVAPGARVLEIGCGTGRNLVRLARRYPAAVVYGVDASEKMLDLARRKRDRAGLTNIHLASCLAEELDHARTFDAPPFDVVFFSYTLSMIPDWRAALRGGVDNLAPGGSLHVVDFWDQAALPGWFRRLLTGWLSLFHVRHEPALLRGLRDMAAAGCCSLTLEPLYRRYAYRAVLENVVLDETPARLSGPGSSAPEGVGAPVLRAPGGAFSVEGRK